MIELPTMQQLKCLLCYGQEKNFTKAAQRANITQSAFSAQIKKLEETIGMQLIVRSNKESHLTPAGNSMLAAAERLLGELQQEIMSLRCEQQSEPTLLKIGVMRSLGDVLMNRHVQYFQQHEKHISLAVYDMESSEILTDLRDDKIDLASLYMVQQKPFAEYEQVHFCWDKMVYYAPCLTGMENAVSRQQIKDYPLVYYPANYFIEQTIRDYFPLGQLPPSAAILSTPYAMLHFCQQNIAGAILPKRFVEALGALSGAHELQEPLQLNACIIFKKNTPKRRAIDIFTDYICKCFNS